ncbi:hypothetical protein [Dyadobacter arcticus]|uniref:Lipoprotein n=1 Tax=Dyadobacter arcticus TaxID=1078754 RepID=A0ABX0ULU2_9BACT|nr:hypothetical protein [Dyadobacter arcticus]NIJ52056.1 hypothetical protein [Dyadobacter arcticus]
MEIDKIKAFLTTLLFGLAFLSCDFHPFYKENETVLFQINNVGNSAYALILVYAKDSLNNYVDSTPSQGNLPSSDGVSLGITLSKLKDVKDGVFEAQVTMLSGKFLSKEFGVIDGLKTRQKFKVDLKDSTIVIR